jgi:hypothetical protein
MSASALSIDIGTFSAKPNFDAGPVHVVCRGEGDVAALPELEQLVKAIHDMATSSNVKEVTLDVREVSFMNSSCFTKLIAWITRVREMTSESRYRIRIKSNQQVLWQRRSLHALQCFAVDLITIES